MDTRRRTLLLAALSATLATRAAAPPGKVCPLGMLLAASRVASEAENRLFIAALQQKGYIEGTNLQFEWRFADGNYDRVPAMARDLVDRKVDIIVTTSTLSTQIAQK